MAAQCPFADLNQNPIEVEPGSCPVHAHTRPGSFSIPSSETINISVRGGTHQCTEQAAALLADIGGSDRIREACTRFYARAFLDETIKLFFFEDDGAAAHGKRLADWIIEKMDPFQQPWTESGRLGQRQPSHLKAWNNSKRDAKDRGKHFDLKDTRIWMRLHFWAFRECGLLDHEPFSRWFKQFIKHFIAVYEREAPPYVEQDAMWSKNPEHTQAYETEHRMADLLTNPGGRTMLEIVKNGLRGI
eukprot:GSChrysophyteH1.ASY1.ANO1.1333.1 assembled CDS